MFKKKWVWVILVAGLMINNIGLALIIGDNFEKKPLWQNETYITSGPESAEIIVEDEEVPGGRAIESYHHDKTGYFLCVMGLSSVLIMLTGWKIRESSKK